MAERDVRRDVHVKVDALGDAGGRADDQALRPIVAVGTDEKRTDVAQGREARADSELLLEVRAEPLLLGAKGVAFGAWPPGDHFGSHTRRPSPGSSRCG